MPTLKAWNFDNDPHILREMEAARNLARQMASTRRQQWESSLRLEQTNLEGQRVDHAIAQAGIHAKRPLLEAARLQSPINAQKLEQTRLKLSGAQIQTAAAGDEYRATVADRQLKQTLLSEKLRATMIQAQEARALNEAAARRLSIEHGGQTAAAITRPISF